LQIFLQQGRGTLMFWDLTNLSLFFLNSILVVLAALMVITVTNPIYSILFLVCVFVFTTFIFVLLNLHFLAMILLIVYLGAVCVLFLFIVMMLNIKMLELKRNINFIPFFFVLLSFSIFLITFKYDITKDIEILNNHFITVQDTLEWSSIFSIKTSIESVALVLYSFFFFQFIVAGLVLFLAMIGAILLTLENLVKDHKKEDFFYQLIRFRGNLYFH
jgi:NADH:ubiquinone oxidoreductase subunit 6 (subunit J)